MESIVYGCSSMDFQDCRLAIAGRLFLQNAHLGLFEKLELSWGSLCCRRQLYILYMLYEQYTLCKQYKLSRLLP